MRAKSRPIDYRLLRIIACTKAPPAAQRYPGEFLRLISDIIRTEQTWCQWIGDLTKRVPWLELPKEGDYIDRPDARVDQYEGRGGEETENNLYEASTGLGQQYTMTRNDGKLNPLPLVSPCVETSCTSVSKKRS